MIQPSYAFTKLHDGREVQRDSEEWKLECLALYVLSLGDRGHIEEWLRQHEKSSGQPATALRERMNAIKLAQNVSGAKRQEKGG